MSEAKKFYDESPAKFTRFSHARHVLAIRRAVWGEGVETRNDAVEYVNHLIFEAARTHVEGPASFLDLGCGLGGSLLYMSARGAGQSYGVTISGVQAVTARKNLAAAGVDNVEIHRASFADLPPLRSRPDVAFAIESFVYCDDLEGFFRGLADTLGRAGLVIICDDLLAHDRRRTDAEQRHVDEFISGWKTGPLFTAEAVTVAAEAQGFDLAQAHDLTGQLELSRPRDKAIKVGVTVARALRLRSSWLDMLRGGDALQWCLRNDVLSYRFLVFKKRT